MMPGLDLLVVAAAVAAVWFVPFYRLPTGVKGLLVAAIIAAAMSMVSSTLNSGATVLLEDYRKRFELKNGKPLLKQRKRAEIHCLKRRFASSNCRIFA